MLIFYPSTCKCQIEIDKDCNFLGVIKACVHHENLEVKMVFEAIRTEQALKTAEDEKTLSDPAKLDEDGNIKEEYKTVLKRVGDELVIEKKGL